MTCNYCKYTTEHCICKEEWYKLEDILNTKIDNSLNTTKLCISTMTVCFSLENCEKINLANIPDLCYKTNLFTSPKFVLGANKKTSAKNDKKNKVMFNQCELKAYIKNGENKVNKLSLMIFSSGSFKLVGVKYVAQIPKIVRILDNFLKQNGLLKRIDNTKGIYMNNVRICMINTNFQIFPEINKKNKINQEELRNHLNQEKFNITKGGPIKSVCFDQDSYPGVKIKYVHDYDETKETYKTRQGRQKYEGEVSIFVFSSGKFIITGGNKAKDIHGAYKFVNKILEINKEKLIII